MGNLVYFIIPFIVILFSAVVGTKRTGSARICPEGGFSICRGWHKMFFGAIFLAAACALTLALNLDIIAKDAEKICTLITFALFFIALMFILVYYVNRLDVKGDRFVFVSHFGAKTHFALSEIKKVKFSPSFFRIVLYTEKGTIRVDGYMRDAWYLIEMLRKAEVPGISFAAQSFYAHRRRPDIFYKSYSAYTDRATDIRMSFSRLILSMLRHYENCALDCPENARDFWSAVNEALLKARVTGENVGFSLTNKLRRFAIDHEDWLTDAEVNAVRDLCYNIKYDLLYKDVIEKIGFENTYSHKDFVRVMFYLEASMGCPPADIFFNSLNGGEPDIMYALYPATEERSWDMLCSVGVGAKKLPVPKGAEQLSYCEIAQPLAPDTYKDIKLCGPRLDRFTWFTHPHTVESGPVFLGPGMIFGSEDEPIYAGEPYNYLLLLYMFGKFTSVLHMGKGRLIHFYQPFPLYTGETKLWEKRGDRADKLLAAFGLPDTCISPARPEVTAQEFFGEENTEESDSE